MQLRKYGAAATVLFPLIARGLSDLKAGATFAAGDGKLIKDEGASANTTNLPTDEGNGWYSLVLTATEMQAARLALSVVDQSSPKVFEDQAFTVETYGNGSAQHELDLDDATLDVNVTSIAAGAINAVAIATDAIDTDAIAAGAIDAAALATDAVNEIADGVLSRPISNVEPSGAFRTLYGAIAALVNRRRINGGNLEVFKTDDSTVLGTLAVTTDAAQDPVKELDPS